MTKPRKAAHVKPSERRFDYWRKHIDTLLPQIASAEVKYRERVYDFSCAVYYSMKFRLDELQAYTLEQYHLKLSEWLDVVYAPIEELLGLRSHIFDAIAHGVSKATFVAGKASKALAKKHSRAAQKARRAAEAVIIPPMPDESFSDKDRIDRLRSIIDALTLANNALRMEVKEMASQLRDLGREQKDLLRKYSRQFKEITKGAAA